MSHVITLEIFKVYSQGLFLVFSWAEIRTYSQWNLGDFLPNFEAKSQSYFFKTGTFIQSTHTHTHTHTRMHARTHTSYMVTFSFNLISIVCVIADLFFIDQKLQNCALKEIPNEGGRG